MTETELRKQVKKHIFDKHRARIRFWDTSTMDRTAYRNHVRTNGLPDLSGIIKVGLRGVPLAIELKTPKGKLRPEQEEFLTEFCAFGGAALVVRDILELDTKIRMAITILGRDYYQSADHEGRGVYLP